MAKKIFGLLATSLLATPALAATITIVNGNAPGVGFNDPTPAAPYGGNSGTTLGQQRLNAFQHAANLWGAKLDSASEIRIFATFEPLTCTATSAVLGSAGPISVFSDFPGAVFPATWYHVALANKQAGTDLDPAGSHIRARFNSNLGATGCLTGTTWYLGLDTNQPPTSINLVTVLLHEFGHGLGFSSVTSVTTGAMLLGQSDAYSKFYFDNSTGLTRDAMTDTQRRLSAINPRNVVWTGPAVTTKVPQVLGLGTPLLKVNTGAAAGDYAVGAASFGAAVSNPGVTGDLVVALDGANAAGASTTDACTAITNPAAVAGKIAVVDRGTCGFVVKVKNAQDAGAIAVLVADNAPGGPPAGLGGADPTITIPSVRITQADGATIKAAIAAGTVNATLGLDMSVRAGADRAGRAMLYTPNPVQQGSSVSHWDTSASPNQLMEPSINNDLTHELDAPEDLTRPLLRDVGWYPDADLDGVADDAGDQCLGSDLKSTVVVAGIDTGIANAFFTNGCSIRDLVARCKAGAANQGGYVSCTANLANTLVGLGYITTTQVGKLQSAVARDK